MRGRLAADSPGFLFSNSWRSPRSLRFFRRIFRYNTPEKQEGGENMGLSAVIDSIRASDVAQTTDSMELYRTAVFVPSGFAEPPVRLSVLDVPPHQPGGETLVLLHGYAANSSWWRPQIPALAQENRVIALDARGNGLSAQPETGYTTEQLADDVAAVLDDLGVTEPVIVAG
ncbi:MAG TPA: alpha/beta fold hydrolase, partial [Chloroflexi bacterium]|nr:alpha/beta fold hydrolase [Chloroflexota bacterium]